MRGKLYLYVILHSRVGTEKEEKKDPRKYKYTGILLFDEYILSPLFSYALNFEENRVYKKLGKFLREQIAKHFFFFFFSITKCAPTWGMREVRRKLFKIIFPSVEKNEMVESFFFFQRQSFVLFFFFLTSFNPKWILIQMNFGYFVAVGFPPSMFLL